MVLFELLMIIKTKESIVVIFSKGKEKKRAGEGLMQRVRIFHF